MAMFLSYICVLLDVKCYGINEINRIRNTQRCQMVAVVKCVNGVGLFCYFQLFRFLLWSVMR